MTTEKDFKKVLLASYKTSKTKLNFVKKSENNGFRNLAQF